MSENQNPYDFILNSGDQPKKTGLGNILSSPSGKKQRLIFIIAGVAILLIIALIVFAMVFSGGGGNREQLLGLAQKHAEIIRVADIGVDKAKSSEARNLAMTTKLSLQSSQSSLMEVVQKTGKVSNKELAAGQNKETDTALESAERNNRFDEAFVEILAKELTDYRGDLQTAFSNSSSASNKKVYSTIFGQTGAILPEQQEE